MWFQVQLSNQHLLEMHDKNTVYIVEPTPQIGHKLALLCFAATYVCVGEYSVKFDNLP